MAWTTIYAAIYSTLLITGQYLTPTKRAEVAKIHADEAFREAGYDFQLVYEENSDGSA